MGDLLQLKPCKGTCIFERPRVYEHEINLWTLFELCKLEINQRHSGDIEYGHLCARLRIGEQTAKDIQTINSRLKEFENSIHLCSRKKTFDKINQLAFNKLKQN